MQYEGFPFDVIDRVILFTGKNEQTIREEFDKLIGFYKNNNSRIIDDMLDIKSSIKKEDYYSDQFRSSADDIINNLGQNDLRINPTYLVDSHAKVYKQIKAIPENVLLMDPMAKVFFYDLLHEPGDTGSRLVLSALILDWREYCTRYFSLAN